MKRFTTLQLKLLNIEESLQDTKVDSLLNDGWEVVSYLPVVDNGEACIILIFFKKEYETAERSTNRLEYILFCILLLIASVIVTLYIKL